MHPYKILAPLALACLAAAPAFSQKETKLRGTELTGRWRLLSITDRCPKNDSIWRPALVETEVTFFANGQMVCSNPSDPFFGGMTKWELLEYGTTLSMLKNPSEGGAFQPDVTAGDDILFNVMNYTDWCEWTSQAHTYRRAEKMEPPKPPAPAFVPDPNDPVFVESQLDSVPVFGRGASSVLRYNSLNIEYPEAAREAGITGRVVVEMIVEKDGSLSNFNLVKDIGGGCGEEALRILKKMPKWIPGKKGGERVRVKVLYPVAFMIE